MVVDKCGSAALHGWATTWATQKEYANGKGCLAVQHGAGAKLGVWQLVMLALGSTVGGGFFLSTAVPLKVAGLGILLAFGIGGFISYIILTALSEMTMAHPSNGSFREYAEMAYGPMAGFIVGWVYWAGVALGLASEAIATALFARLWLPGVPIWVFSLVAVVGVTLLNLLDVSKFSIVESAMSGIKIVAIILFALLMTVVVSGLIPVRPAIGLGALRGASLLAGGVGGLAGSMLIVFFAYAGFLVLGLAAPDAKDPERTVPRAVTLTVISMIGLYLLGMLAVLAVLPLAQVNTEVSPFVSALEFTRFARLGTIFNVVIMSAAISTMLATMYGVARMLQSLAEEGQAPAILKQVARTGQPRNALLASSVAMLVGVILSFVLPKAVYLFLISASGFAYIFSYLAILASQLVLRKKMGCPTVGCQMPGYPYLTWLGILLLLLVVAAMPMVPGQGAGLVMGLGMLALCAGAYWLKRGIDRPERDPEPLSEEEDRRLLR